MTGGSERQRSWGAFPNRCTDRDVGGVKAGNGHYQMATMATELRVRDRPLADSDAYQAWLDGHFSDLHRHRITRKWDGRKLRRAVQMKRNGCSSDEMRDALGVVPSGIWKMLNALPAELKA